MHVHVQVFSVQKCDLDEDIIMSGRTLVHLQCLLFCFVCCCFSAKKTKKQTNKKRKTNKQLFWKSWTRCQYWNVYTYSAVLRKIRCSWDAALFCKMSCSWGINHGVLERTLLQCCFAQNTLFLRCNFVLRNKLFLKYWTRCLGTHALAMLHCRAVSYFGPRGVLVCMHLQRCSVPYPVLAGDNHVLVRMHLQRFIL